MKKILIVDDEKKHRKIYLAILTGNNYSVELAENASAALEILDNTFGLVITDIKMPGFDGIWLAEKIEEKFKEEINVVLMTEAMDHVCDYIIKQLRISGLLLKPFSTSTLLDIAAINM